MKSVEELIPYIEIVNDILRGYLPKDIEFEYMEDAMNYSVLLGGKRLRPIILLETYKLFTNTGNITTSAAAPFAAALEFIQAYSLVHDDLPAMDNDTYRRGQLTTHVKYGHAMGVLTGDALLNLAMETVSDAMTLAANQSKSMHKELFLRYSLASQTLFKYSGYSGMIGGQVFDVCKEAAYRQSFSSEADRILRLYELKTSGLFKAAFTIGAILGGADATTIKAATELGRYVGLSFQIKDDILDITSTTEELGKEVHNDEKNNLTTIASLLGIVAAQQLVEDYTQQSLEILDSFPGDKTFLKELILFLVNRTK